MHRAPGVTSRVGPCVAAGECVVPAASSPEDLLFGVEDEQPQTAMWKGMGGEGEGDAHTAIGVGQAICFQSTFCCC